MSRRDDLAAGLAEVEERLVRACEAAGRDRSDVTLVVVTKTYPASDVVLLAELGVRDVGENRHPEAGRKREEVLAAGHELRWHFVGALQSKKASAVGAYADVVHSLDREKLVAGLSNGAHRAGRDLEVLVQVSLDDPDDEHAAAERAGAAPGDVPALAAAVAAADGLVLRGVMGVAPLDADPAPAFAALAEVSARVRADHPAATVVSAGMSGDLEQAVASGATHVRVGRAVLGERAPTR
ncbi:MAG: YggS family pyridoxal phosphate-dependent enzyme [Nocardioidaceae bacterium]|nr:YggS family pyridoxal phosphate-dependent enzyme [Nocardioidaceae bacterium]